MEAEYMSVIDSLDFKNSLHCLDCAYQDQGYNGLKLCKPKTISCQPVYPYDLMISSKIRKHAILESNIIDNYNDDDNI